MDFFFLSRQRGGMANAGCGLPHSLFAQTRGVCHHCHQGLMAPWHPPPRVHVPVPLACACPYPLRACAPPSRTRVPLPRVCMPHPLHTCTSALIHPTSPRPTPPCLHFACGQDGVGCTGPGWCARACRAMRMGGAVHKGGSGGHVGPAGDAPGVVPVGWCAGGVHEGGSGERAEQGEKGWSPGQLRAPPQFAHN